MRSLIDDIRFTFRLWRGQLSTTLAAIACLAIGIGGATAIFSLVDNLLLRPMPFQEADELVTIWNEFPGQTSDLEVLSGLEFQDIREQIDSLESATGYISFAYTLGGNDAPERVLGARVSSELFRMLGQSPAIGRVFELGEEAREAKVVVLSNRLFERRYGGDQSLVGRSVLLDDVPHTVIGVMPESFRFLNDDTLFWVPLVINPRFTRNQRGVTVVGRLADGASVEQSRLEFENMARRWGETYPNFYAAESGGHTLRVVPLQEIIVGDVRPLLMTLLAAVTLVLLIACSNVANLLLVQSSQRERELALRAALGAERPRLIRQLLTESLMLALAGGAIGAIIAHLLTKAAVRIGLGNLPRLGEVAVDGRVLLFSLIASAATGIIFGLVPAIRGSNIGLFDVLKQEGRASAGPQRSWLRPALVVAQVALAAIVLIGAGLVIRSFQHAQSVAPGFQSTKLLSAEFYLPFKNYREFPRRIELVNRLIEDGEATAEIESVAVTTILPFSGDYQAAQVEVFGRPKDDQEPSPNVGWRIVSANYFETLSIPLLRGRTFNDLDHAEANQVTVIDETLANRLWPDGDPIGQRLTLVGAYGGDYERTIVGVVGAIKEVSLEQSGELLYIPYPQRPFNFFAAVVRTRSEPETATALLRGIARGIDPELPVSKIATIESLMAESLDGRRFNRLMFVLFGGVALILTAIGVYSLMAYSVAQRRREIGLRAALGATPDSVRALVLRQSLRLAIIGILGGVACALVLTWFFAGSLGNLTFGIGLNDTLTYVGVILLLTILAAVATYVPAWSASRVDPAIALHEDA